MRIEGKVIVITGGASGLGLAAARYLVQEKGARVAIFDLNAEAGDKAVNDVGAEHAMFVPTDVSNEESVQIAVAAVVSRFGAIHVCINCAALPTLCKVLGKEGKATPLAKFAQVTAVNVNAIAPGLFLTPMVQTLDEKIVAALKSQIEAPRRLGDMREFAHCCAFIIENAYLNAHTIRLDAASRLRAR